MQSEHIAERIEQFDNKLYLELGGKLFDDYHASRVLPGFKPDSKIRMLMQLSDRAEIVIAVSAVDIEKNKIRGDLGITYDDEVIRLIEAFRGLGFFVSGVVITQYAGQFNVDLLKRRLAALYMPTYYHYPIKGYPNDVPLIVSDEGYGRNDYIQTTRPLVIVTAPGPGSGKMATCLSQLYHEYKRGIRAGYAKFETFPIWNLPLKHPVNLAYEAATADLRDVNMIDPFHLETYGERAVNYNRDVEAFPLLSATLGKIMGECPYHSPTDMGVNMAGYCITDDEVVSKASLDEIIRRYYTSKCRALQLLEDDETVAKIEMVMTQAGISVTDRVCAKAALEKAEQTGVPCAAIELEDGTVITGKTSALLGASSAMLLNTLKYLAGIPDEVQILAQNVIEPVQDLKIKHLGSKNPRLHTDETLVALSVCAAQDELAAKALEQIPKLRDAQVHTTVMLSHVDKSMFKKLGVQLTCESIYEKKI
jgi:uncharacterized protein (UPF0371 family)